MPVVPPTRQLSNSATKSTQLSNVHVTQSGLTRLHDKKLDNFVRAYVAKLTGIQCLHVYIDSPFSFRIHFLTLMYKRWRDVSANAFWRPVTTQERGSLQVHSTFIHRSVISFLFVRKSYEFVIRNIISPVIDFIKNDLSVIIIVVQR